MMMLVSEPEADQIITPEFYSEDYYEYGQMTGKSSYSHYRWMPELSFRMAMAIIEYCNIDRDKKILDFGCAKGFLVKALRHLFRDAYGCDWASYAIENAETDVRKYVRVSSQEAPIPFEQKFDLCIAKDVFEHIPYYNLIDLLLAIRKQCNELLVIVPLGNGEKYFIDEYEADQSHIIRENKAWWEEQITSAGFQIISSTYNVPGIKDAWYRVNKQGNAVIYAEKNLREVDLASLKAGE